MTTARDIDGRERERERESKKSLLIIPQMVFLL
jgi:hypothetical protein